ncbi:uncharacterized protein LOC128222649 [Mya arenaria]|uniref:uncharacterized protein LOC128222649 n=1 Tax=Mya arenaria TaxID=6604 RepID=UPI0022E2EC85|nr:uncharacterized protein LOC128222649 [Mya arenaria]
MVVSMPSQEGQTCKEKVSQLHKRFGRALPSLSKDDEVLRYGEEEAKTGCNTISDYRDLQQHRKKEESKKSEEKKSEIRLNIEGSQGKKTTKNKKECKRNTKFKIPKIVPISLIVFGLICQAGTVPVHGRPVLPLNASTSSLPPEPNLLEPFGHESLSRMPRASQQLQPTEKVTKSAILGLLSKPLAIKSSTRPHGRQPIVSEKASQLGPQQIADRGEKPFHVDVQNCSVVEVFPKDDNDICDVAVNNVSVGSCVFRHEAEIRDPKFMELYSIFLTERGSCIFIIHRCIGTQLNVNISSTKGYENATLDGKAYPLLNDSVNLNYTVRAPHGAQEVDPETDVPLNRSTETDTDTNEKESEVQDNGLPAWAIVLIVIAVILIVAIPIAVIVWNHFKQKASHGAEVVDQGEDVPLSTFCEIVTETNGADVSNGDVPNTDAVADEAINDSESILPETGIPRGLVGERVKQFSGNTHPGPNGLPSVS